MGFHSDGFFYLEDLPKRAVIVGAGYIAVELAGVLHTLGKLDFTRPTEKSVHSLNHFGLSGAETHLLIRHEKILKAFDPLLQDTLQNHMTKTGIHIHQNTNVTKVTTEVENPDIHKPFPKTVFTDKGEEIGADVVLWAIGRHSLTDDLGIENVGVELAKNGDVVVDEYQKTNVDNIFAIGDVQERNC